LIINILVTPPFLRRKLYMESDENASIQRNLFIKLQASIAVRHTRRSIV